MPTVYVNDRPVEIGSQRLNCVDVAGLAGVLVPHYCYHPSLSIVASCRMCLVEVGDLKDGKVTMQPKVLPGCQTPVKDGTVIVTGDYTKTTNGKPLPYDASYKPGDRAKKSQADTLEGLLLNHPLDCPVCDKAGECKLQDYSYSYGRAESRLVDPKNQPPNKPNISSKIALFTDRCIMCSRCVRFTREISGTAELTITSRGHHTEIDIFPGRPLENKLAGNVVDLCPVGALGSKDFLYTQRVWYLKTVDGVCPGCSTGCSTHVDINKDMVYRLRGRENPAAQGYYLCDEGRYGYHYLTAANRIVRPTAAGKPVHWHETLPKLKVAFSQAKSVIAVLSPFLTVEEAFLFASYFKSLPNGAKLVLGPVPVVGVDDTYPKDLHGHPVTPAKFTIRAEKCPNRLGVEAVLQHFQGEVISIANAGSAEAVYYAGGYPEAGTMTTIGGSPSVVVVQDLFHSSVTAGASYTLPATAGFEKDGTYVNHAGLSQTFPRAVLPPKEVRSELQIAHDLLGRIGLVRPATVRSEVAAAMPMFAGLTTTAPTGTRLTLQTV